tara:strand:+ start:275 stop:475 length:201 start_codon:yes stop_codon:yes gene_type:complete
MKVEIKTIRGGAVNLHAVILPDGTVSATFPSLAGDSRGLNQAFDHAVKVGGENLNINYRSVSGLRK